MYQKQTVALAIAAYKSENVCAILVIVPFCTYSHYHWICQLLWWWSSTGRWIHSQWREGWSLHKSSMGDNLWWLLLGFKWCQCCVWPAWISSERWDFYWTNWTMCGPLVTLWTMCMYRIGIFRLHLMAPLSLHTIYRCSCNKKCCLWWRVWPNPDVQPIL